MLVIDEFISEAEQNHFRALADDYRQRGILEANPSGPLRFRAKVHGTDYCDRQMQQVAVRIRERIGIGDCPVDPYLGWIISYIEPGGAIKPHIDRHQHYQTSSDKHLRCNILVQGANESAYPVIDHRPLAVAERGLWAFVASEHPHGTAELLGDQPRIVYQFGFVVPGDIDLADASSPTFAL